MRVLVACEESQAVCIAFRECGHEAYSCDIQPCNCGDAKTDEAVEMVMERMEALKDGSTTD